LTAAQAFEFRKPMKSGVLLDEVHKEIRKKVAFADKDRVFSEDIEKGIDMIKDRTIIRTVQKTVKRNKLKMDSPFEMEFEEY
jgi:histidine ammonia-lyase